MLTKNVDQMYLIRNTVLNGIELKYFSHAAVAVEAEISFEGFTRERWKFHQLFVKKQHPGHNLKWSDDNQW